MTRTYQVKVAGEVRMTFRADFAQAASPITLEGDSTPFQVADAKHRPEEAAQVLIGWCDSEGTPLVGEEEEYTVEATEEEARECRNCGKVGPVAEDETDPEPDADEMILDARGLVCLNYYVCGACLEEARSD
jgi:hypothetical protein